MKKILILIILFVAFIYANNCKDWSNNSDNCLYDTTYQRPKFGNTEDYMKIGETACRTYNDQYYTFLDSVPLDNGLYIKVKLPRRICREIEDITSIKISNVIRVPRTKIDYDCCDRAWETYKYKLQCYHGELYGSCQSTYYVDSTFYTYAYQIKYSDSAQVGFDVSKYNKAQIELDNSYYIDNEIIEIYRDDGTLRYKGELTYIHGDLENRPSYKTRGWCYNKLGTKETRKTNNVRLCK